MPIAYLPFSYVDKAYNMVSSVVIGIYNSYIIWSWVTSIKYYAHVYKQFRGEKRKKNILNFVFQISWLYYYKKLATSMWLSPRQSTFGPSFIWYFWYTLLKRICLNVNFGSKT